MLIVVNRHGKLSIISTSGTHDYQITSGCDSHQLGGFHTFLPSSAGIIIIIRARRKRRWNNHMYIISVIALDQPLYTVAKQIQWNFPEKYGKDKFVIMFGGLHVKIGFLKLIGSWLEGSRWGVIGTQY